MTEVDQVKRKPGRPKGTVRKNIDMVFFSPDCRAMLGFGGVTDPVLSPGKKLRRGSASSTETVKELWLQESNLHIKTDKGSYCVLAPSGLTVKFASG